MLVTFAVIDKGTVESTRGSQHPDGLKKEGGGTRKQMA